MLKANLMVENKRNGEQGRIKDVNNEFVIMELLDGSEKAIKVSTFKRWFKVLADMDGISAEEIQGEIIQEQEEIKEEIQEEPAQEEIKEEVKEKQVTKREKAPNEIIEQMKNQIINEVSKWEGFNIKENKLYTALNINNKTFGMLMKKKSKVIIYIHKMEGFECNLNWISDKNYNYDIRIESTNPVDVPEIINALKQSYDRYQK